MKVNSSTPAVASRISISLIRIVNPRHRDRRKFQHIVDNIKAVGLKKPITVNRRASSDSDRHEYDLVCGQGRLEAFRQLGETEIPAVIVDASKETCLLMGLIENMARRRSNGATHFKSLVKLKALGYTHDQIGLKIGVSPSYLGNMFRLLAKGEERLLDAVLQDKLPVSVAMEIADMAESGDQADILEAYASGDLDKGALITIKRLLEQRRLLGKAISGTKMPKVPSAVTAPKDFLANYQREAQKQKGFISKARRCEERLHVIVGALKELLSDENFVTLLRAEDLLTIPANLAKRVALKAV